MLNQLKVLANKKDIPYQSLIKVYLGGKDRGRKRVRYCLQRNNDRAFDIEQGAAHSVAPKAEGKATGLSTSQRKISRKPDEIVRMLRAPPSANLFLQNQPEASAGLVEKLLKLDRSVGNLAAQV